MTGDAPVAWGTAHLLRFLEIAGRTDIPVCRALTPLLRTQAEMHDREAQYGRIPWTGAWNAPRPGRSYHPDQPRLIPPPPPDGTPARAPTTWTSHPS